MYRNVICTKLLVVIINQVSGPPLLRWALRLVGESTNVQDQELVNARTTIGETPVKIVHRSSISMTNTILSGGTAIVIVPDDKLQSSNILRECSNFEMLGIGHLEDPNIEKGKIDEVLSLLQLSNWQVTVASAGSILRDTNENEQNPNTLEAAIQTTLSGFRVQELLLNVNDSIGVVVLFGLSIDDTFSITRLMAQDFAKEKRFDPVRLVIYLDLENTAEDLPLNEIISNLDIIAHTYDDSVDPHVVSSSTCHLDLLFFAIAGDYCASDAITLRIRKPSVSLDSASELSVLSRQNSADSRGGVCIPKTEIRIWIPNPTLGHQGLTGQSQSIGGLDATQVTNRLRFSEEKSSQLLNEPEDWSRIFRNGRARLGSSASGATNDLEMPELKHE